MLVVLSCLPAYDNNGVDFPLERWPFHTWSCSESVWKLNITKLLSADHVLWRNLLFIFRSGPDPLGRMEDTYRSLINCNAFVFFTNHGNLCLHFLKLAESSESSDQVRWTHLWVDFWVIFLKIMVSSTRQPIAVSDISVCLIDIRSKSKEQLNGRRAGLSNSKQMTACFAHQAI